MISREQAIINFIEELAPLRMHGFLLSLGNKTLAEGYYAPYQMDQTHRMFSVSKSVVSLAIGILEKDGMITLDEHICDHFPEWVDEHTHPLIRMVTIRDMLRMATCYDRSMYAALRNNDWTKPFFYGQPTHIPGTLFSYDTCASQVMCALVEKKTHTDILSFMEERLFSKIGMNGPKEWLKDQAGTSQGGTGLKLTLRDYAKLAQFCMSDGCGIINAGYLHAATTKQIFTGERSGPEERFGYGYQFWMTRNGFSMYGLGGQMAICMPDKQLALCTTADLITDSTGVQPIYDAFYRHLSNIDQLSSSAEDQDKLTKILSGLRLQPMGGTVHLQTVSVDLNNHTLPFSHIAITPKHVILTINNQEYALPYHPDTWENCVFPASQEATLVSGGWQDSNRFELQASLCGDFSACMKLFFQRSDHHAAVRIVSSLWEFQNGWDGQDWGTIIEN